MVTLAWAPQRLPPYRWTGLGLVAPKWVPLLDALAYAFSLCTKEERRTLRGLAPAWHPWSSWLASRPPHEVQRDQDQQDGWMEVTVEPKQVSPPEPLAGEDQL